MSVINKGAPGADGQQPPVTIEAVMGEVTKLLDTKISAKFDDFKKNGLGDAIKAHTEPINGQLTTINDALAKLVQGNQPPPDDKKGTVPPELNAQLRQLGDTVKSQGATISSLQAAKETAEKRAEETERHSVIQSSLNGMPFVNEKAAETAFSIVKPFVRRLEDQTLVASLNGDNFPVQSFAKDFLEKEHSYLFKPSGASGSGVPNNQGGIRMGTKVDISSIKPGMKSEDRAAAVAAIAAAVAADQ